MTPIDSAKQKHIHVIGIAGSAMAPLAGMLREHGLQAPSKEQMRHSREKLFNSGAGQAGIQLLALRLGEKALDSGFRLRRPGMTS